MPGIRYAFFCEDLRPEEGGKVTALGMFGPSFVVHGQEPSALRSLAFYACIANPDHGRYPYRVRISGDPLPQALEHRGELSAAPDKESQNVCIVMSSVPLLQAGSITAEIVVESEPEVRAVVDIAVRFAPAPT